MLVIKGESNFSLTLLCTGPGGPVIFNKVHKIAVSKPGAAGVMISVFPVSFGHGILPGICGNNFVLHLTAANFYT